MGYLNLGLIIYSAWFLISPFQDVARRNSFSFKSMIFQVWLVASFYKFLDWYPRKTSKNNSFFPWLALVSNPFPGIRKVIQNKIGIKG